MDIWSYLEMLKFFRWWICFIQYLPLMLPSDGCSLWVYYEDFLGHSSIIGIIPSECSWWNNQSFTGSQKEILLWHWRLVHANLSWIQRLLATRNETNLPQAIITKLAFVSSCKAPLCWLSIRKKHRKRPGTSIEIKPAQNLHLLKSNHLQPCDKVSIDQITSAIAGRLEKELKRTSMWVTQYLWTMQVV